MSRAFALIAVGAAQALVGNSSCGSPVELTGLVEQRHVALNPYGPVVQVVMVEGELGFVSFVEDGAVADTPEHFKRQYALGPKDLRVRTCNRSGRSAAELTHAARLRRAA